MTKGDIYTKELFKEKLLERNEYFIYENPDDYKANVD